MTDFYETWYVGSARHKCYLHVGGVSLRTVHYIAHFHICSDWLITTKANIQSSMSYSNETWWYMGRGALKDYPCVLFLSMCILNTEIAYLFVWLITTKSYIMISIWAKVMKLGMVLILQYNHLYSVVVNVHIKYLICKPSFKDFFFLQFNVYFTPTSFG